MRSIQRYPLQPELLSLQRLTLLKYGSKISAALLPYHSGSLFFKNKSYRTDRVNIYDLRMMMLFGQDI